MLKGINDKMKSILIIFVFFTLAYSSVGGTYMEFVNDDSMSMYDLISLFGIFMIFSIFYFWIELYKEGRENIQTSEIIVNSIAFLFILYDIGLIIFSYGTVSYLIHIKAPIIGIIYLIIMVVLKIKNKKV